MKHFLLAAALSGQTMLWSAPADSSVEKLILQYEKELNQAMISGDASAFERLEAVDVVDTAPDGNVTTKAQDISDIKSRKLTAAAFEMSDTRVRVYGHVAVITGKSVLKNAKYGTMDISGAYRFTDTWVESGGKWQLAATQATAVQKH